MVGPWLVWVGFAAGVASLVARWRRAPAGEVARRQISLLALAAGLCLAIVLACASRQQASPRGRSPRLSWPCSRWCRPRSGGDPASPPLRHRRRAEPIAGLRRVDRGCDCPVCRADMRPLAGSWGRARRERPRHRYRRRDRVAAARLAAAPGGPGDVRRPRRPVRRGVQAHHPAAGGGRTRRGVARRGGGDRAASLRLPYVAVETASGRARRAASPPAVSRRRFRSPTRVNMWAGCSWMDATGSPWPLETSRSWPTIARPAGAAVHAASLADALGSSRRRPRAGARGGAAPATPRPARWPRPDPGRDRPGPRRRLRAHRQRPGRRARPARRAPT